MKSDRFFLSINTSKKLKKELEKFQHRLKETGIIAKFVEKENLHINLKFFGNLKQEQKEKIIKSINKISKETNSFTLKAKNIGVFPNEDYIKVVWVGIEKGEEDLIKLQKHLEKEFEKIGIKKENRNFVPHITLCRVKSGKNIDKLIKEIKKNKDKEFGNFEVKNINLMKSNLLPEGPKYIPEKVFELKK